MFKRLSLFTVILSGVLLAGCANTQSASTAPSTKTEQKSTTKSAPQKSTESTKSSAADDSNSNNNEDTSSSTATTKSNQNQSNNQSSNGGTSNSSSTSNNANNQATQNQQSQSQAQTTTQQGATNITTADQATAFLADQLSSTYDKTQTSYVANGKVTWNNVSGYQINIYSKDSTSPVGSYLVPANGQYFQIW